MTASSEEIERGLAFVNALDRTERNAFLALFAGARFDWTSFNGDKPHMGKAECEWVDDWRDFYGVRLRDAGLFHFEMGSPQPALGMKPGSTYVKIEAYPTDLARSVRDAWWDAYKKRLEQE